MDNTVIHIRKDLHSKIKRIAAFNDIKIYRLINAIVEEALQDKDKIMMIVRKIKISS